MLADEHYTVTETPVPSIEEYPQLINRLQLWELAEVNIKKYIALAHFPFAGDEHTTEKMALSVQAQEYCDLINSLMESYDNDSLIFCADFNFNPYLIKHWQDRSLDKIPNNNSILLTAAATNEIQAVTVDGILLSTREKQKYHASHPDPNLFARLKIEYRFFRSYVQNVIADWPLTQQRI